MRNAVMAAAIATNGTVRVLSVALAALLLPLFACANTVTIAQADTTPKVDFNIPRLALADALAQWSKQTGLQVLRRDTDGTEFTTHSVTGKYSPAEALEKM